MMKIALSIVMVAAIWPINSVAQTTHQITPAEAEQYCSKSINGEIGQTYCAALLLNQQVPDYCAQMNAGFKVRDDLIDSCAAQTVAQMVARRGRQWFARFDYANGLPKAESQLVIVHGIPCHVERYSAGTYHKEVFWYCDDDGGYTEGYTFVNGRLMSDYVP